MRRMTHLEQMQNYRPEHRENWAARQRRDDVGKPGQATDRVPLVESQWNQNRPTPPPHQK